MIKEFSAQGAGVSATLQVPRRELGDLQFIPSTSQFRNRFGPEGVD